MNLNELSDNELLANVKRLRTVENRTLAKILHHLGEIDRRRLFADLRFGSLFDYAVSELKYSEPAAIRRISAMRVLRDLPEIETSIESGGLSLSNLALAQTMFSKEARAGRPLGIDQKRNTLEQLQNKSAREGQKIVRSLSPEMERNPGINYDDIQNEDLRQRLLKLRGQVAHVHPQIPLEDLLLKIFEGEINLQITPTSEERCGGERLRDIRISKNSSKASQTPTSIAAAKRDVWRRDKSQCANCRSTYAVQIDHIVPAAAGGLSTVENMRLLCRSCNQRAAVKFYGLPKMARYLREQKVTNENPGTRPGFIKI